MRNTGTPGVRPAPGWRLAVLATGTVVALAGCGASSGSENVPVSAVAEAGGQSEGTTMAADRPTASGAQGQAWSPSGSKGPPRTAVEPTGEVSGPPPLPDPTPVTPPAPFVVTAVPGASARPASWNLAGQENGGRVLLLDVSVGGPPCDVVTGTDVDESAQVVRITVHAGAAAGADCSQGVPARLGTVRVRVQLKAPLGARALRGSAVQG